MQVLVYAHLSSGFLNWANATAPPEHVQILLGRRQEGLGPKPYPPSQRLSLLAHEAGGGSWQGDPVPKSSCG